MNNQSKEQVQLQTPALEKEHLVAPHASLPSAPDKLHTPENPINSSPDPATQAPATTTTTTSNIVNGVVYVIVLILCFSAAAYYRDTNLKLALAWLLAGVVTSQIAIDLGKFSSPESKGRFSAVFRLIAAVIAVGGAYLIT